MSARFSKSPSPMDEGVAHLEVELLQKKKAMAEVKELWRKEAEEKRHWEEEAKKQEEEVKHQEEEEQKKKQEVEVQRKQKVEEARKKHEAEEAWRKQEEVKEEQRKKQEEEERITIIAKAVDNTCRQHVEKEQMKQLEMTRREELWGKSGGESGEDVGGKAGGESGEDVGGKAGGVSGMWRCDYCIKKNMACHWPSMGSKARSCSQCREHKVMCVVGGKGNKKRKEWGSPEKVVRKKTKTAELVAWSSFSKDVTLAGLDINQQLILELLVIHCTLHAIHMTPKEVSSQVDLDWLGKKDLEEEEEEDGEELGKELEEKGEENPEEEMTLDDEVVELAKEKAQEK